MTDKEFRRLSRADLIEIIYTLQKSERTLQEENENLRQQLEERRIAISKAGSIAEAAIALSGVIEAAQDAADQYLLEIRAKQESMEAEAAKILGDAKDEATQILEDAKTEASKTLDHARIESTLMKSEATKALSDAEAEAQGITENAKKEAKEMVARAETEASRQWQLVEEKTGLLLAAHEELRSLLEKRTGSYDTGAGTS